MSYSCKILLDSISETGKRLTTFEITFPRCVLAEFNTHRMFSRNSASSRAIPISKMLERVRTDPFIPEKWGKPVAGMGAKEYWPLNSKEHEKLVFAWKWQLGEALETVELFKDIGNKEDLNRLLEPFMWHTVIVTATEFDNFFKLRTNPAADWKIRKIADLMYEAYHAWESDKVTTLDAVKEIDGNGITLNNGITIVAPQKLKVGEWHCPLVSKEDEILIKELWDRDNGKLNQKLLDLDIKAWGKDAITEIRKIISVARCARVSYLTHDGKRDIEKDLELFEKLRTSGHWSPFEHVATPYFRTTIVEEPKFLDLSSGNFIGWKQYRKEFQDENCTNFRKTN